MKLPEDNRPTARELHERAELIGVAVKHDVHGGGEVVQGHPTYGYLVEYEDNPPEWHHINALEVDYEWYANARENHLNTEHARERGLIK